MDHWNLSRVMDTVGVKNEPLTAGEFKDALDPYHPLSDAPAILCRSKSWMQCTNNSLRTLSKAGVRNY
nr:hypothetical protein [Escherichia coli]